MKRRRYMTINALLWGIAIIGAAFVSGKDFSKVFIFFAACAAASNLFLSESYKRGICRNDIIANGVLWAGAISASAVLTTRNLLALLILLIILALSSTTLLIKNLGGRKYKN